MPQDPGPTENAPAETGKLDDQKVARVGSWIPAEDENASPVSIYNAERIAKLGVTDVNALMQRLPITSQGSLNGNNGGNGFAAGSTGVSLRGLGLNATLVLLNGRRIAPFSYGDGGTITFANLNSLPLPAIERVEILREGASAIYGADAIAGVINVVTKQDFDGLVLKARYGNTFNTDTAEQQYSITYGTHSKNGKTSLLVVADYLQRNALFNRDRSFSNNSDQTGLSVYSQELKTNVFGYNLGSGTGSPGYFRVPRTAPGLVDTDFEGSNPNAFVRLVPPSNTDGRARPGDYHIRDVDITLPGAESDRYNYLQHSQATPDSQRFGIFSAFDHRIFDDKMTAFGYVQLRRDNERLELAPPPMDLNGTGAGAGLPIGQSKLIDGFEFAGNQVTIPATNPWNPFGTDIKAGAYRFVEAGNRVTDVLSHTYNFTGGFRGNLLPEDQLSYETALNYSRSEDEVKADQLDLQRIQAALNDPNPATSLNLFGGPGYRNNPATMAGLRQATKNRGATEVASWDGRVFGGVTVPVWKPGKLQYAAGAEYRNERFSENPDKLTQAGRVVGESSKRVSRGDRSVAAGFMEGIIPLTGPDWHVPGLYRLEVKAAGRIDSYSDFGSALVPLVGIAWRPINEDWMIRGSYGQSFRPPSLRQLFNAPQDALTGDVVNDAWRPNDFWPDLPIVTSGNPNLQPETSDNWSIGSVLTPAKVPGLRLEAQWFQIKRRNEISPRSFILGGNDVLAITPGSYVREPYDGESDVQIDPQTGTLAGQLISLKDSYINVGSTIVDAIDFGASYDWKTETAGTWTFQGEVTKMLSYRQEAEAGSGYSEYLGTVTGFDGFPEWKTVTSLTWAYRRVQLTAVANFRSGMEYADLLEDYTLQVGSFTTFDLQAGFDLPWRTRITVGIENLLDAAPPRYIGEQGESYLSAIDTPFGRRYYFEISKRF